MPTGKPGVAARCSDRSHPVLPSFHPAHPPIRARTSEIDLSLFRFRWVLGQLVTFKLVSADTAGHFSAVEIRSSPGEGVPPHLHLAMDELFYVLDGAFEFTFGSRVERVEPGGLVFVPRGTLHSFRNVGRDVARLFDVHSPGGFEAFFEEAGTPARDLRRPPRQSPDVDWLLALFQKHGMEMPLP
jgi:mannose-6-phosphate isomerase-like protein (cupin superfamily)